MRIRCVGAAREVTGSRHLIETRRATVLLDCGLFQGRRRESRQRNLDLGFDAGSVDAVVLSHAHIDHSGALPLLCKHGYRGAIHTTPATRDLCAALLADAAMIQATDARYLNRAIERDGVDAEPIEPLYDGDDVAHVLGQMICLPYHRKHTIAEGVSLSFLEAGHVLGSAIVVLDIDEDGEQKRVVFTGDLGRKGLPILRDPEVPSGAHVLITESTYGDRLHAPIETLDDQLAAVINRVWERGGKVVIPSFALERAQQIVYSLKKLRHAGKIPRIPVYVDSPLAVNITQVFRLHPECYDAEARELLQSADPPFEFEGLTYVTDRERSIAIDTSEQPCVIISASGMCEGGRVLHHLRATVDNPKHAVVIVGFQAQHTLGRRIVERRPSVRIFGVERALRAEVAVLDGFSAHADQRDLLAFAEAVRERGPLRQVLLVHGEPPAQDAFAALLARHRFPNVRIPGRGDMVDL